MPQSKRVLVVGLGNMGMSHALAYARIEGFAIAGLCSRGIHSRTLPAALAGSRQFTSFEEALAAVKPDVVSINTLPHTHAPFALKAMATAAHEFLAEPVAAQHSHAGRVGARPERSKR